MAWVAVDKNGDEHVFDMKPIRSHFGTWKVAVYGKIQIPRGSIKKLIGKELTWNDEPVKLE
jgi:hypothetical protein